MRRYVVVRIVSVLPTLLGVSFAVFLMVRLIPGTVVDQIIGTEGTYSAERCAPSAPSSGWTPPSMFSTGGGYGRRCTETWERAGEPDCRSSR